MLFNVLFDSLFFFIDYCILLFVKPRRAEGSRNNTRYINTPLEPHAAYLSFFFFFVRVFCCCYYYIVVEEECYILRAGSVVEILENLRKDIIKHFKRMGEKISPLTFIA